MNSAVIDVAIGLILMYLVLSLVCTVLNELFATITKARASTLETSLKQILDVPALQADFYNHGLIAGAKNANNGSHCSYLTGTSFAMALLGSLDPTKPLPAFADIEGAVKNLPDSNIRDALLTHIMSAQGSLEKLRDNIASWFDDTMDRVSGIYKRYLKLISLIAGLAVAVALNADSIKVGVALWHDPALRAQMVADASDIIKNPPSQAANNATASGTAVNVSAVVQQIQNSEATLRPLPLGWNFSAQSWPPSWPGTGNVILKLCGLILTGLALSLGAPFWFDLLSQFMNLRGTGPAPEKTDT